MEEEHATFLRYAETTKINSALFDHTGSGDTHYAVRLNGSESERIGLARSLAVMTGDTIKAEVYAKHLDPDPSNWTAALQNLMAAIAAGTAPTGTVIEAVPPVEGDGFPFAGLLDAAKAGDTGTRAYLNILLFDEGLAFLDAAFVPVTTAAKENGTNVPHEKLSQEIVVQQPGYAYIYFSNDNDQPLEVFFDDFTVELAHSAIVQVDDYYPFGLTFNGYRRENGLKNKWKFQGQEHIEDLGLNWVSFKWRNHQPDIGRFFNVDPLAEDYYYNSPYAFSENRVIDGIELEGLEWKSIKDKDTGITTRQLTVQMYNEAGLNDKQLTNVQNSMKNQFAKSFSGEGGTAQLIIENATEPKGDFVVTLKDAKSTIIKDAEGNPIKKTFKGGKASELGQTQKNSFDVTVTTDGTKRSNSSIARSFSHEAGHTAGLRHPHDPENTVSDIKQGEEGVKKSTVSNNLMNTGTNKANPSTSGTSLTPGQLGSVDDKIKAQQ